MRGLLSSVGVAAGAAVAVWSHSSTVVAAPAADLVVVWAPGAKTAPVRDAVRRAGSAMIDRSPTSQSAPAIGATIQRGIAAYDALRIDDAWATFDEARAAADATGGASLGQAQLADLFLYRGLVRTQQGDPAAAWDELVTAATIDPTRVLDPGRFPPRVVSDFDRARAATAGRPRSNLTVDARGCAVVIDGNTLGEAHGGAGGETRREPAGPGTGAGSGTTPSVGATTGTGFLVGPHWVHVDCADRPAWGTRVELTASADLRLTPRNAPFEPPADDEILIQARSAGAAAFIIAEVRDGVAIARLIGVDGRERDRRSVTVTGDLGPLAAAVAQLLEPIRARSHWYQSRWAWAASAAVAVAAIVIPITVAVSGRSTPTSGTIHIPGSVWGAP